MKKQLYLLTMLLMLFTSQVFSQTYEVGYIVKEGKTWAANAADPLNDPIVQMLNADANFNVTVHAIAADGTVDLTPYDLVICQESFGSGDGVWVPGHALGLAGFTKPVIYNKLYAFRAGKAFATGEAGAAAEVANTPYLVVDPANQSNDLFKGITFDAENKFAIVKNTAADDGAPGTKSLQYGTDQVISATGTLLGTQLGATGNVQICVNDFPAGTTIGGQTTQARIIAISQNYGSIMKDNGKNFTSAGLTMWRNAAYMLVGLAVPATPVEEMKVNVGVFSKAGKTWDANAALPTEDPIIKMLEADGHFNVTAQEVAADAVLDLSPYDIIIAQESFGSGDAIWMPGNSLGLATIDKPVIYNKLYAFRAGKAFATGEAGAAAEVADMPYLVVDPANQTNDLFKGIVFDENNQFKVVKTTAADDGAAGTKSMQYGTDQVIDATGTLLATQAGATGNVQICINDFPANTTIGGQTTKVRMIAISQNYGSIVKDGGDNFTGEGLTMWRNAAYILSKMDVPATALYNGPIVAYWKMDEGSGTAITDAIGDNDGTLFNAGAGAWIDGHVGKAIDFTQKENTDTACYITIPNDPSISFADQDFTVSTILKINDPSAAAGETSVWAKGIPFTDNGGWYHLSFKSNALRFMVWDGTMGSPDGVLNGAIAADTWAHVVCVRDAVNKKLRVYVNGVLLDESDDLAGDITSDGNFYIGTCPWPGTGAPTDFDGAVDELIIYKTALTAEEIEALADGYGLKVPSSLVANFMFDEGTGTAVSDAVSGAVGAIEGDGAEWVDGVVGKAIDLTNAVDTALISVPDTDLELMDISNSSLTLSLLVKFDPAAQGDQAQQELFIKGSNNHVDGGAGANGTRYEMYAKNGGIFFCIDDDVVKTQLSLDMTGYPVNQWVHLVGVRDMENDSLYFYMNGVLNAKMEDGSGAIDVDTIPLLIGNYHNKTNRIHGAMDEVKVFAAALTPEEIKTMFDEYGITYPSSDCSLKALSTNPGTLTPAFDAATTSYSIEVAADVTSVTITASATDDGASVTGAGAVDISSLAEGASQDATVTVTAEDGTVCSYTITINKLVGVENNLLNAVKIYPNPTQNILFIDNAENSSVEIFNLNGAMVKRMDVLNNNAEINVSDLNSGVYFLKVQMSEGVRIAKFVKE